MPIDPVWATELCPSLVLMGRQATARLTGRLYYFNGQKNPVRVFQALNSRVPLDTYVATRRYPGITPASTAACCESGHGHQGSHGLCGVYFSNAKTATRIKHLRYPR